MPTYTYNGLTPKKFETDVVKSGDSISDVTTTVKPGESFESFLFLNGSDLTLTADTPLKSRYAANAEVSLGAEAAHILNAETKVFLVTDISGICTVKPQVTTAVPVMLNNTESSVLIPIYLDECPCNKLLISGSGSCKIIEFKW